MAQLITGNLFKLLYSDDPANNVPMGASVKEISNLAEMPTLTFKNTQLDYETYDSNYKTVLLSNKDVEPFDIAIHYVPTEESTVFLDSMANNSKEFQSILNYRQNDGTIDYAIVSGVITATSTTGDKDSVVNKVYTFTPLDVISELRTINALQPLYEGSFGVGSNGVDVPQYEPVTPDGNSFIKVPADQADNPVGADMLGIGLVDMSSVCKLAISKAGNLNIYAMNTSTAWTRVLTATQIANQYVALSRTVNGKALTSDIVLNNTDVGLGNVTNEKQLVASKNLSDVTSVITARKNLDVYSTGEVDSKLTDINNNLSGNYATKQNLSDAVQPLATKTELSNAVAPLATKTELSDTAATLVPKTTTVNGKPLSSNIVINSTDTGSLAITNNLSDLNNVDTARKNLDVYPVKTSGGVYSFLYSPDGSTVSLALGNNGLIQFQNGAGIASAFPITSGGTGALTIAGARTNFQVDRLVQNSTNTLLNSPDFKSVIYIDNDGNWGAIKDGNWVGLDITRGGTGATTLAGARTNLQIDRITQNPGYTILASSDATRMVIANGGDIGFQNSTGNPIGLPIAGGGTGGTNVTTARNNLNLGAQQEVTFGGVNASLIRNTGDMNGGILASRILNDAGAVRSQGRVYHEQQSGISKITFHVQGEGGANSYMQFTESGDLTNIRNLTTAGSLTVGGSSVLHGDVNINGTLYANANTWVNQGYALGVRTTTGGNKNIMLQNAGGDGAVGSWVNLLQGNWYKGYYQFGAIRTGGADIDHVRITINDGASSPQGSDFKFYTSYGGHIVSPRGVAASTQPAGGWGLEGSYMSSPYYINNAIGNDGGWAPFISGGSQSTGGYQTRVAFGVLGGTNAWGQAAIKLLGDGAYQRAYQFNTAGDLYTWGNDPWGGNYMFSKSATSDRNLKHDIQYTDGKESYDRVMKWLPTMFKYNGQVTQRFGLIAQDLQDIDEQYVKVVPGSPIFEQVEEVDEETGETKTVNKETGEYHPDTLSLDNNVLLTDLACAFVYASGNVEKLQSEIDELKALVQKLLDK